MLTYNLTATGSDSLYESLYKCIKNDILQGKLCAGEKLPSKRSFAKNLGISVITVENAYGQLSDEGYIYSMPKRGFYVSDIDMVVARGINMKGISQSADRNISGDNYIYGMESFNEAASSLAKSSYFADFSSNQTDSEIFPFSIWSKTVRSVLNDNQIQLMINSPCAGILPLRNAIAHYLRDFRGMQVFSHQIIIGAGTEYLYGLLIQLLGKNLIYGVENPGYHKIGKICKSMGVTYRHVDLDENGVSIHELEEKKIDIIHTSPSHHFPTGIVMPVSRRYELLGWAAKKKQHYIIEDDYDSELRLNGQPIPALQNIDVSEKVIYINTFTKTLSSTVRISYMVLPEKLLDKFYKTLFFYSCTVSNFEQYTLAKFIDEGCFEKHINRMRKYYSDKRKKLFLAIKKSKLNKYVTVHEEDAGLQFLMEIKTKYSDEEFVRRAAKEGIKMSPLSGFYHLKENRTEHIFVMNYLGVEESNIEKTVEKLCKIIAIKK